jgi:hypothetical protein
MRARTGGCGSGSSLTCSLLQKETELKLLSSKYSDTSTKMQDLSPVLDDGTLLADLDNITTATDLNPW